MTKERDLVYPQTALLPEYGECRGGMLVLTDKGEIKPSNCLFSLSSVLDVGNLAKLFKASGGSDQNSYLLTSVYPKTYSYDRDYQPGNDNLVWVVKMDHHTDEGDRQYYTTGDELYTLPGCNQSSLDDGIQKVSEEIERIESNKGPTPQLRQLKAELKKLNSPLARVFYGKEKNLWQSIKIYMLTPDDVKNINNIAVLTVPRESSPYRPSAIIPVNTEDITKKTIIEKPIKKEPKHIQPTPSIDPVADATEQKQESRDIPELDKKLSRPASWYGVVGQEMAIRELKKVADQIKRAQVYAAQGVKPEQGILLHGPSRTGKSLLAEALAKAINADTVIYIDNKQLSKFVNATEENLLVKLTEAGKLANEGRRVIVIMNEINQLAPNRRSPNQNPWKQSLTETLLTGIEEALNTSPSLVVVGTTNFIEQVDEAVRLPGRLGLNIKCMLPESGEEVFDLIKQGLYLLLDSANKHRSKTSMPMLKLSDVFVSDRDSTLQLMEAATELINYPQATIIKGVEKAARTNIMRGSSAPLTTGQICTGISEYAATHASEEAWFSQIRPIHPTQPLTENE